MNKIKQHFINKKTYYICAGVMLSLLLIIFACFNLFPFGTLSLAHYDGYYQVVPLQNLILDFFEGKSTIYFTNMLAGGTEILSLILYFYLNPFFLIGFLFGRANLMLSINLIIILQMIFTSLVVVWFLRKYFTKLSVFQTILLAVAYSISPFILFTYTCTTWMAFAYLMPFLVHFFIELIKKGKIIGFSITLLFTMITCYGVGCFSQILIFILLFAYTMFCVEKEKRKKVFLKIVLSYVSAICLALFLFIPSASGVLNSSRQSKGFFEYFLNYNILEHYEENITWLLMNASFIILTIMFLIKSNKKDGFTKFSIISLIILILPLFINGIMLLLNFGSFYGYEARLGYLVTMIFLINSAKYFESKNSQDELVLQSNSENQDLVLQSDTENFENIQATNNSVTLENANSSLTQNSNNQNELKPPIISLKEQKTTTTKKFQIGFLTGISVLLLLIMLFGYFQRLSSTLSYSLASLGDMCGYAVLVLSIFIPLLSCLVMRKMGDISKRAVYIFLCGFIIIQTCLNGVLCIGGGVWQNTYANREAINLTNGYVDSCYDRVKDESSYIGMNGSLMYDASTYSIFSSTMHNNLYNNIKRMGYEYSSNSINSNGGTLFSDCLLGYKYFISTKNHNDRDYLQLLNSTENCNLYENNLVFPNAFEIDNLQMDTNTISSFQYQNSFYNALGGTGSLIEENALSLPSDAFVSFVNIVKNGDNYLIEDKDQSAYICVEYIVQKTGIAYLNFYPNCERSICSLYFLNESNPEFEIIGEKYYEFSTRSNFLMDLGMYDTGEHIKFAVEIEKDFSLNSEKEFTLGFLDYSLLQDLSENLNLKSVDLINTKDGFTLNTNFTTDKKIFISKVYYQNYKATTETQTLETESAFNDFLIVNAPSGNQQITVKYELSNKNLIIICAIIGLIVAATIFIINKYFYNNLLKRFEKFFYFAFIVVGCGLLIFYYVFPIIMFPVRIFQTLFL